ncbi:MAG: hypothetical protein WCI71_03810 [Bacteroidota bacterium]
MKAKMIRFFQVIIILFIAGNVVGQEKFNLEFRYAAGTTYRYRTTGTFSTQQQMNGQEMKVTGTTNSILRMFMESVSPEGNMTFINSYDEMKSSFKNSMLDTVMDQKDLIGKRGKVVLDKRGKQLSSEIMDSVPASNGLSGGSMAMVYSVNLFKIPDQAAGTGEKWSKDINDTTKIGDGAMISAGKSEYTLVGTEKKNNHDCFKITFTSNTEITGKMHQMGMEFFIEGTGETTGTIWFDQKLGILISKESTSTHDFTYAMTGQMKMSIPMTQVVQNTFTLIEE